MKQEVAEEITTQAAVKALARKMADAVNITFESLKIGETEFNPYRELPDGAKTHVMVEAALIIVAQAAGMAAAQAKTAAEQEVIKHNMCNRLKEHIDICRVAYLEMGER